MRDAVSCLIRAYAALGILIATALAPAAPAFSQSFPTKAVRVVTGDPGGGTDFVGRLVAQVLGNALGQPMIVENRGGASGILAAQSVAKAAPDGHTLLLYGNRIWILQYLRDDVPFDAVKDFSPITLAVRSPNILVLHPAVPIDSVRALIASAKARPGSLNYAATGSGTPNHMAAELFRAMAGVDLVRINYKGTSAAMNGLLRNDVQIMFATVAAVLSHIKAGKLKVLGVTSAQPSALLPDVPTVAASGLPGYESGSAYGYFAPAGTSTTVITRLNQEIAGILRRTDMREKLLGAGVESVGSTPEEFAAVIKSEMTRMGKVIKDAGIRED